MARLGNDNGPLESQIIEELGYKFFGITAEQFENDFQDFRYSESRGYVVPLHVDLKGCPYIVLSKNGSPFNFFLEGKFSIKGDIATYSEKEQERYFLFKKKPNKS